MKKWLLLAFLPLLSWAATETYQFESTQQEADYRALIQSLRCPQCQNNNIADSNSTIATDMRDKTLELLKQGKSKEEVVTYMVERYGNFVTYDPPLTPATVLLWVMPLLLIVGGFGLIRRKPRGKSAERSWQGGRSGENFANVDQQRLNKILNEKDD